MFLNEKREIVKEIDGIQIKFRYPSITDEIQIEARKHTLTRGQYSSMAIGILLSQQKIMDLLEAVSVLTVVASFIGEKEKETYFWEGFVDDDGKDFVLKVHEEFKKWRLSFRKNVDGNKKIKKTKDEKSD